MQWRITVHAQGNTFQFSISATGLISRLLPPPSPPPPLPIFPCVCQTGQLATGFSVAVHPHFILNSTGIPQA